MSSSSDMSSPFVDLFGVLSNLIETDPEDLPIGDMVSSVSEISNILSDPLEEA